MTSSGIAAFFPDFLFVPVPLPLAFCINYLQVLGKSQPYSISGSLPLVRWLQDQGYDVQICGYGLSSRCELFSSSSCRAIVVSFTVREKKCCACTIHKAHRLRTIVTIARSIYVGVWREGLGEAWSLVSPL